MVTSHKSTGPDPIFPSYKNPVPHVITNFYANVAPFLPNYLTLEPGSGFGSGYGPDYGSVYASGHGAGSGHDPRYGPDYGSDCGLGFVF